MIVEVTCIPPEPREPQQPYPLPRCCTAYSELKEEYSANRKTHLLQFAVFLIPIIGMLYKTYEVVYSADKIKEISDGAITQGEADLKVKKAIRNLQVSDFFFGIASETETFIAVGFGFFSLHLLPFLIISVIIKTCLLYSNKEGLYQGYLQQIKQVELPERAEKTQPSTGELTNADWIDAAINGLIYCIPYLGTKIRYENTLLSRAEYIHPECSGKRREHLEQIRNIHRVASVAAKAISLTIIFSLCSLMIGHPLVLTGIAVTLIASAYFSGKIDIKEVYANDLVEWKRLARLNS